MLFKTFPRELIGLTINGVNNRPRLEVSSLSGATNPFSIMNENIKPSSEECRRQCKKFDPPEPRIACGAPICRLFGNIGGWFADEEICTHPSYKNELCYKNQRKIARTARDSETFFTAAMLDREIIIKSGLRGLDPDRDPGYLEEDVKKWLRAHPAKRTLSDEARNKLRERFSKVRGRQPEKKVV